MKRRFLAVLLAGSLIPAMAPVLPGQQEDEPITSHEVTIPEGTEFKLQLHTTINSKTSKAGDRVITSLLDPVAVEDRDVLVKGGRVDGHIGEVRQAGRHGKGGYVTIIFDTVELPNGEKVAILGSLTEIFSSEGGTNPNVGPEGELKGRGASRKEQLVIFGGSAAAGTAGGLVTGVAAGVGGLITAILLPKGKQAVLPVGALIGMRLDRDMTFTPPPESEK